MFDFYKKYRIYYSIFANIKAIVYAEKKYTLTTSQKGDKMKKKIVLALSVLVCVFCCAFALAACGDTPASRPYHLLVSETGEQPNHGEIDTTYGEKPDLTKYKLYLEYTKGEIKPLDFNDEKLQVKYYYQPFNTLESERTHIDKLPDEYIAGTYTIEYTYDTLTDFHQQARVYINVNRAASGAFKVLPTKAMWYEWEKTPDAVLKNPKNLTVTKGEDSSTQWQTDDGNGSYNLYIIKKAVYDTFTDTQKTDYDFIGEFIRADYDKSEHEIWGYFPDYESSYDVGEYVYFGNGIANR